MTTRIENIMLRYKEVFGQLATMSQCHRLPIGSNAPRAQRGMEDHPPQRSLLAMPQNDAPEIEKQVDELMKAGLVEPFLAGNFPKFFTPTFLVNKKESKTRRMVGQYAKLNERTTPMPVSFQMRR